MEKKTNMQFCLLSALGIVMVVDGHLGGSLLDVGGLLQYYFFHMQMFVFISGYFYKDAGEGLLDYGKRKFRRLMIPYFIWNLIYGILAQILRGHGFAFGSPITFETLFIEPFRMGYQFTLNHVAWFVPTLFLVEMVNGALSRALHRLLGGGPEVYVRTGLYFLISLAGIWVSKNIDAQGFVLMAVRVMFLLAFYGAGTLYREKLEAVDTLKNRYYFPAVLSVAFALALSGRPLIYGLWNCRDIPGYVIPYAAAFAGIAFWLRAARVLAPAFENSALVRFVGRNTFSVMMHHMMVFFLINCVYGALSQVTNLFGSFDFNAFHTDFYYCYLPRGITQFKAVYLLAGVGVPLGLRHCLNQCRRRLAEGEAGQGAGRRREPG